MKKIVLLLLIALSSYVNGQVVYPVTYYHSTVIRVTVVDNPTTADALIYITDTPNQVRDCIWFFTSIHSDTKYKITFVNQASAYDLKVYFVTHPSQAKWINISKKKLFKK